MRLTPMKPGRWQPAVDADTKWRLIIRAIWVCEAGLPGCEGRGTDPHHRSTVGMGGRKGDAKGEHDELGNLLWLCRSCHNWIGLNVSKAEELGMAVPDWVTNPATVPVRIRGNWGWLNEFGSYDWDPGARPDLTAAKP